MDKMENKSRETIMRLLAVAADIEHKLNQSLGTIKGITFSEFQLLSALESQHGNVSSRVQLADIVGMTPSGVTRALRPLEKIGFVKTEKDRRDARRSLAVLTVQGVDLVADASGVLDDSLQEILAEAAFTAQDRKQLHKTLRKLKG